MDFIKYAEKLRNNLAHGNIDNQYLVSHFKSEEKSISNKLNSSNFPVEFYSSYGNKIEKITVKNKGLSDGLEM